MKRLFFFIIFLICFTAISAQQKNEKEKILNDINNDNEAINFIYNNPNQNAIYGFFDLQKDTNIIAKICYSKKSGDVFYYLDTLYKILEKKDKSRYRASYIYLDGYKLSKTQIDSLRNLIIIKYKNGESFKKLAEAYNMDGNPNGGDLGWFEAGKMHTMFESAVVNHNIDEVFTIDINGYKWYYVVKKTHSDQKNLSVSYIKISK